MIAFCLFLLRLPFLLIHHIQEDAFITFRTARHLAEHGDFSYNLGEHFPGTTSQLYPILVAAIDWLLRRHFIVGVQIVGTACVVIACYFAAKALSPDERRWPLIWILSSCSPVALIVSYTGMETPLLFLALGCASYGLGRKNHPAIFVVSILFMPLIRPDAVAYAIVFILAMLFIDRRNAIRGGVALIVGCSLLLVGNVITSGSMITTTMKAKQLAYHPSHAFAAILARIWNVFLHQSFLLPVSTTYLVRLAPLIVALTVLSFVVAFRTSENTRERTLLAALGVIVVGIPAAYALGGVIFDWYLYPANWLAILVVIAVLSKFLSGVRHKSLAFGLVFIIWTSFDAVQWARSLAASTQDYHYRADIGRYLKTISTGQQTLFLEPAGYIPYFAELRTDDEVGLVSNRIRGYMLKDPISYWIDFVGGGTPHLRHRTESFLRFDGVEGPKLSPLQQAWFFSHYRLVRRLTYNPSRYHPSPYLKKILAMGPMPDYLIYERIPAA